MSTTDAKQDASTAFTTTTTTADSSATFTTTTRPIVDWVSFPEHNLQLWMDNGDGNYYSCAENCAKIGGRLYEPKNAQEYAAVGDFASGQFNFDYWIGINNIEQESKFVYTSSGSAVTFYAWEAADLFKDKDIERCVASNYGQWQLQNCFFVKRCACEKVYTKPNPVPFSLEYLEESSSHNLPCCKAGVLKSTGSLCTEIQICNSHYDFLASLPGNKDIFVFALHGLINTYLNVYNHNGEFKLQMAVMPEAPQTRFTSIQTVNETNSFCPESFVGLQFKRYSDNSLQYDNQAHFVCQ